MQRYHDNRMPSMDAGQAYHQSQSSRDRNTVPHLQHHPEYHQPVLMSYPGMHGRPSEEQQDGNCLGLLGLPSGHTPSRNISRTQDQYNSDPFLSTNQNHAQHHSISRLPQVDHSARIDVLATACENLLKEVHDLRESNTTVNTRLDELEEAFQTFKETHANQTKASKPNSKNISNQHREVKVSLQLSNDVSLTHRIIQELVHSMFWNLCDIDQTKNEKARVEALPGPLANGVPFEVKEDSTRVWRPDWKVAIDKSVNAKFIREIVERIMDDENVCRLLRLALGTLPSSF